MFRPGPPAWPGQRIGLLGGSFDPPHAGHRHITGQALTALRLDAVWWLVSPGNPLKSDAPASLARRMAAARRLVGDDRRVVVSDLERRAGTRTTVDTLSAILRAYPGVRFVWLMGADNLAGFHRWDRWQAILAMVPVCVLGRPGEQLGAGLSPTARAYARWRVPQRSAAALPLMRPPAWTLLSGPMLDVSSTEIRARGRWKR